MPVRMEEDESSNNSSNDFHNLNINNSCSSEILDFDQITNRVSDSYNHNSNSNSHENENNDRENENKNDNGNNSRNENIPTSSRTSRTSSQENIKNSLSKYEILSNSKDPCPVSTYAAPQKLTKSRSVTYLKYGNGDSFNSQPGNRKSIFVF